MKEKSWARFSLSRVVFWIFITCLGVIFGWIYSVAFVSVCSLYANIASDFASWRADRNTEILKRLETIEKKLDDLAVALR